MTLALFATLAWLAVRNESATADEPLHSLAGFTRMFYGDFRLDTEHPPLWEYWAMLPHRRDELKLDFESPIWKQLPMTFQDQPTWATQTLYQMPGNDPIAFIQKSRAMMLIIAIALGAAITAWAWRLGGPAAGVIACGLYSLDPNFIAHGPLVVNDVSMALGLLAIAWAIWRCGRKLTAGRSLILIATVVATLNIKFSALLCVPILLTLLTIRCSMTDAWAAGRGALTTRATTMWAAAAISAGVGIGGVLAIWACYGFHGSPSRDDSIALNLDLLGTAVKWTRFVAASPQLRPPSPVHLAQLSNPPLVTLALAANAARLLPQAYLAGFLHTLKTTQLSPGYLLGQIHRAGCWYYFPAVIAFKTPLATLLSFVIAGWRLRTRNLWTAACLAVPPLILLGAAMVSNLNIGIRHILPIYPFAFIAAGVALARILPLRRGRIFVAAVGGLLALETFSTVPNELNFFNLACGGPAGGFRLLGDSNLDWGQDLPRLAQWQQANPQRPIYLCYFGMADPAYYVRSQPLLTPALTPPTEPCVLAISATMLQGMYLQPREVRFIHDLTTGREPIAVLGGSIYLFDGASSARQRIDAGSTRQ